LALTLYGQALARNNFARDDFGRNRLCELQSRGSSG
jgi:hypothetical protein